MEPIKIIIAGGRDFTNGILLYHECDRIISPILNEGYTVEIVSGMARGADTTAVFYASDRRFTLHEFYADWDKHGKSAGQIRNKQMGDFADMLIAFHDGSSRGTKNMIDYMRSLGKRVEVIHYRPSNINELFMKE